MKQVKIVLVKNIIKIIDTLGTYTYTKLDFHQNSSRSIKRKEKKQQTIKMTSLLLY